MGPGEGLEAARGGALLVLRWLRGWHQRRVSEECGLSASLISAYEQGKLRIRDDKYMQLAVAFRVSTAAVDRLAAAILAISVEMRLPAATQEEISEVAAQLTDELIVDLRAHALPLVLEFFAEIVAAGEAEAASELEEARRNAGSL